MNVGDMMSTDLVTCSPNESLAQVARKLQQEDIGSCPVVDQDKLVGIVTDRDIAVRAVAKGLDPNDTKVSDIMSTDLIFGNQTMTLEDAARMMGDNQVRRLPIVEEARLVGIVALADLAIDLEEDELLAETVERISEPSHF
jgi:CBS domain-containing protein